MLTLGLLASCGGAPELYEEVPPWGSAGWGVAHVAGSYRVPLAAAEEVSFVEEGARWAHELGASTLKLYLTPDYAQKYPGAWPQGIDSLRALAASEPMRRAMALPFSTIVLTTYSFAAGTDDGWRHGLSPQREEAIQREWSELVVYLLETYAGSGRRFILQNWEGDWSLRGGVRATVSDRAAHNMVRWISARQAGVERGRALAPAEGVEVWHALEVNRLFDDASGRNVTNLVLPRVEVDAVSYSTWESLERAAAAGWSRTRFAEELRLAWHLCTWCRVTLRA